MSPSEDPHASEDPPAESLKVPTSVDDTAGWRKLIDTVQSGPLKAAMSNVMEDVERNPTEVGGSAFTAAAVRKLDEALKETKQSDQSANQAASAGTAGSRGRLPAAS